MLMLTRSLLAIDQGVRAGEWPKPRGIGLYKRTLGLIGYGAVASVLPVWLLLAPRDYLSTFLKIGAIAGLLVALPVILWEIWAFVAPGLYANEKRFAIPFVMAGCLCFGAGTYFGFQFVFPTIFTFLIQYGTGTGEISAMLSMGAYLSLSSKLLFAFGLVFELPVVIFFLARMGIVDHLWLRQRRKYAIVMAFLIGAVLTPPDVFSQTALAVPFVLLYEVGIWIAFFFGKRKPTLAEEESGAAVK